MSFYKVSEIEFGNMRWDEIFDGGKELIRMMDIDVEEYKRQYRKGYRYIESFQKNDY